MELLGIIAAVLLPLWTAKYGAATPTPVDEPPKPPNWSLFRCDGRMDGVYANPTSDCHEYAVCKDGHQSTHYCPSGQAFSVLTNACIPEEDVECRTSESTEEDMGLYEAAELENYMDMKCSSWPHGVYGFYADRHQGCTRFYRCVAGVRHDFKCPSELIFNENINACVNPDSYKCPAPHYHENILPPKATRQIKFFRFRGQKRRGPHSSEDLPGSKEERQVKFEAKSVNERQIKFKRVNQLLRELSDIVKN